MKKIIYFLVVLNLFLCHFLFAGGKQDNNQVVIYSSLEEFRNEYVQRRLNETFPDYQIIISYFPTGNNAAKLQAEGLRTDCDIVLALDTAYLEGLTGILADLSGYDTSSFLDELVPSHHRYIPWERFGGCVAVNSRVLRERDLPFPASYEDLLNPAYRGLISMPNPKSSSTGYMLVKSLINNWGETSAFNYFDKLAENIFQFTSSGSGPINALVQGEAGIGIGLIYHVVTVNNNGSDLNILIFNEGSPFSVDGAAIIKGKEHKPAVKEVFDFIIRTILYEDKELFSPEIILKNQTILLPNFPQNIIYADMTGIDDLAEKQRILEKWKY
jgi:iron(III) transport system substrate-binding protein